MIGLVPELAHDDDLQNNGEDYEISPLNFVSELHKSDEEMEDNGIEPGMESIRKTYALQDDGDGAALDRAQTDGKASCLEKRAGSDDDDESELEFNTPVQDFELPSTPVQKDKEHSKQSKPKTKSFDDGKDRIRSRTKDCTSRNR